MTEVRQSSQFTHSDLCTHYSSIIAGSTTCRHDIAQCSDAQSFYTQFWWSMGIHGSEIANDPLGQTNGHALPAQEQVTLLLSPCIDQVCLRPPGIHSPSPSVYACLAIHQPSPQSGHGSGGGKVNEVRRDRSPLAHLNIKDGDAMSLSRQIKRMAPKDDHYPQYLVGQRCQLLGTSSRNREITTQFVVVSIPL